MPGAEPEKQGRGRENPARLASERVSTWADQQARYKNIIPLLRTSHNFFPIFFHREIGSTLVLQHDRDARSSNCGRGGELTREARARATDRPLDRASMLWSLDPRRRCARWLVALGWCACSSVFSAVPASAFQLVIDCNTMTPDDLRNASTGILAANGSYSIFVNTHPAPSDELWRAYPLPSMRGNDGVENTTQSVSH